MMTMMKHRALRELRKSNNASIQHTLDKNGSLYDPAGTESCDMQIRLVT
jgi:hypothetical protein